MKKLILLAMVIGLFMSGCATTQLAAVKRDMDEQQFKADKYQCVQESRTQWSGGGSGLIGIAMMASAQAQAKSHADQLARMCFEAKGYTIVQIPKGKTWATCTIEERKAVIRQLNLPVDEELCQSCTSLPEYWNRVVSK